MKPVVILDAISSIFTREPCRRYLRFITSSYAGSLASSAIDAWRWYSDFVDEDELEIAENAHIISCLSASEWH